MENSRFAETLKYVRTHILKHDKSSLTVDVGMTVRELSAEAGVSAPYISQLERKNGNRKPSYEIVKKLSKGLTSKNKLNPDTLLNLLLGVSAFSRPDPFDALTVSRHLANTEFKDFLLFTLRYPGSIELNASDKEIAKDAYENWDIYMDIANDEYQESNTNLVLNKLYDSNIETILDGQPLSKLEENVLDSAINLIRESRKK